MLLHISCDFRFQLGALSEVTIAVTREAYIYIQLKCTERPSAVTYVNSEFSLRTESITGLASINLQFRL